MSKTKKKVAPSVVWFNVPADDMKRAQKFYSGLFGWKIKPFNGMPDFMAIETGGEDASPDGGIGQRRDQDQSVVNYVSVDSIEKFLAKVEKLGGTVCIPKTAVPHMGYFAIFQDTENNRFGFWERNSNAK